MTMGCIFSCCCSPIQRRSCPWISNCWLIPKCIREEWSKADYYQGQAELSWQRQRDWERSLEGQHAIQKYKEHQHAALTEAYNQTMASRGPTWQREQDANFRNQQLVNAIYNVGLR